MGESIVLIIIGISAGLLSGLLGVGGAIIIIPALIMWLGYGQHEAQGTTLLMLVLPVGSLAAWQYYKVGHVHVTAAFILAIAFFISSYFGAQVAHLLPQQALKKIFSILLILIGLKMLFFDKLFFK